jgi:hypothetical protein
MFNIENPFRHHGCRINDRISWGGYKALFLQNEFLQIVVLVDKGAEIVQFLYKPLDIDFLWHSENDLKPSSRFVPAGMSSSTAFFDYWTGSWFEVLPNGGPGCVYKGAELGQFAEINNIPWDYKIIKDTVEEIQVALWVRTYRTPFILKKTLTLKSNSAALFIEEEVTNTGNQLVDFMWGHHPVIGAPFLDRTCRLWAPPSRVEVFNDEDGPDNRMGLFQEGNWPYIKDNKGEIMDLRQIPGPESHSMDNCYLKEFKEGWIAVTKKDIGFGLAWDPSVFRYIWLWQALGGGVGYPWYGRTYNMGIEPWTSYPCAGLEEAVRRGTAMQLHPGESLHSWLTAAAIVGKSEIHQILRSGQII